MVKNLPANAEDVGSIPGTERSPREGNGNPLQYFWQATVHGVARIEHDLATKPPPPPPVFLPGKSHRQRSLAGCSPCVHKQLDTTERLNTQTHTHTHTHTHRCSLSLWSLPLHRLFLNLGGQFSSVAQSCLTFHNPMHHSTPGLPVHHQLPEPTQTPLH